MSHGQAEKEGEAFLLGDLWKPSVFALEEKPYTYHLNQYPISAVTHCLPVPDEPRSEWLQVDDLKPFKHSFDDHVFEFEKSTPSDLSDYDSQNESEHVVFDFPAEATCTSDHPDQKLSWEQFQDADFQSKKTYASELGPAAFDAMLYRARLLNVQHRVIETKAAFSSLKLLGLGMESALFQYQRDDSVFVRRIPHLTMPSLSMEAFESLAAQISRTGSLFRVLREELDNVLTSNNASPTHAALAATVLTVVNEMYHILLYEVEPCKSLILLQTVLERPRRVLEVARDLMQKVAKFDDEGTRLSEIYRLVEISSSASPWLGPLLNAFLIRASSPWLDTMGTVVGLLNATVRSQILVDAIRMQADKFAEIELNDNVSRSMPRFLDDQDREALLEGCACLNMLRTHDESNVLAHFPRYQHINPPALKWMLHWPDLKKAHENAQEYQAKMIQDDTLCTITSDQTESTLLQHRVTSGKLDPYGAMESCVQQSWRESAGEIEQKPKLYEIDEQLLIDLHRVLDRSNRTTDSQLVDPALALHLSISPALRAQSRLLNRACLRLLFQSYDLREHFVALYRYSLFGDGLFAARLSEALFSSDMSSAFGKDPKIRAAKLGLRLEDRSTWPPGGSELRLALTGILNECYFGASGASHSENKELPGNLSFGIRSLSEPEIQAVLDPSSLNALDFLRLKYTAVAPLNMIFTEGTLEKYDAIFKLLLRVSRLLAVTKNLFPGRNPSTKEDTVTARFRITALRFVEALSAFFLQSAIDPPWSKFLLEISKTANFLLGITTSEPEHSMSVFALRKAHEHMLDRMLFSLFLRRRQAPVMRLLDEIFDVILSFTRTRHTTAELSTDSESRAVSLYDELREKTGIFVAVCRGLGEQKTSTSEQCGEARFSSGNNIEELELRLDMNGWWSSTGSSV